MSKVVEQDRITGDRSASAGAQTGLAGVLSEHTSFGKPTQMLLLELLDPEHEDLARSTLEGEDYKRRMARAERFGGNVKSLWDRFCSGDASASEDLADYYLAAAAEKAVFLVAYGLSFDELMSGAGEVIAERIQKSRDELDSRIRSNPRETVLGRLGIDMVNDVNRFFISAASAQLDFHLLRVDGVEDPGEQRLQLEEDYGWQGSMKEDLLRLIDELPVPERTVVKAHHMIADDDLGLPGDEELSFAEIARRGLIPASKGHDEAPTGDSVRSTYDRAVRSLQEKFTREIARQKHLD